MVVLRLVVLCGVLMLNKSAIAEQFDSLGQESHQIGFKTGFSSGNGLAYRYWPGDGGIEIGIGPHFNNAFTEVNLGLAGLWEFRDGALLDYYGTLGNDVFYTESHSEYLSPYSRNDQGFAWDVKAGIGAEAELIDRVVLSGTLGAVNERMIRGKVNIKPNAELSLLYAF